MKSWKVCVVALVIFTIVMGGLFVGCGGGSTNVQQSSTTLGQELIDLDRARDVGALSESEYQTQRDQMLGENDTD